MQSQTPPDGPPLNDAAVAPGTFVSYAWDSPAYKARVRRLAERLEQDGVRVVVDFFDLALGADADAYMERMVTDDSVAKVLLLCTPAYKRKADGRKGGVGTESQIITREVYAQSNDADRALKYLAVVMERAEDGSAPVPAYYGSRVYLDLSDEALFEEQYAELVAFLFDKPLARPERGHPPADVLAPAGPSLGTATRKTRALRALYDAAPNAAGALSEYFETFVNHLERFHFAAETPPTSDAGRAEAVRDKIAQLAPYRAEAAEVFAAVARYAPEGRAVDAVRTFFERFAVHNDACASGRQRAEHQADPFRFFWEELFLLATAAFLDGQAYPAIDRLLRDPYLIAHGGERMTAPFHALQQGADSLHSRTREGPQSPLGQLLRNRAATPDEFERIVEADIVLYLASHVRNKPFGFGRTTWFASTAVYTQRMPRPLPTFLRAESGLGSLTTLLGSSSDDETRALFGRLALGELGAPVPNSGSTPLRIVTNAAKLAESSA